jgi:hypothetical protein
VVRYRIANRQPIGADGDTDSIIRWDYVRTAETEVRLPLVDLDDGDEIEVVTTNICFYPLCRCKYVPNAMVERSANGVKS